MRRGFLEGLLFIIFLLAGFPFPVTAEEETLCLSLGRAVELAMARSPDLRKSFVDLSVSGYAASHRGAEMFPGISAGAGLSYGSGLFSGDGFQVSQDALRTSVSLGLTFRFNAAIPSAMKITSLAYQAQLLNHESLRRQVEILIAKEFYSLLAEKENLSHLEEVLNLAERQMEKNRTAFEFGLLGQLAYLQSQLSAETAKLNLSRARSVYSSRLGEFLELLGCDPQRKTELEGSIAIDRIEADPERLIREYLPKRPDVVGQRQSIERLELVERRTLLTGKAPSLSLSAQWDGGWSPGFSDTLRGTVSLAIPIEAWIPGTLGNQTLRAAAGEIEKARLDLQRVEDQAKTEIRSLVENLRGSWENIGIARLRMEIAEKTYELTVQGFQNGTVEFLTLEDTRNNMAEARQQLLSDELAYKLMTLDLAAALNLNMEELPGSLR
ncbi:MAG: TolC family protein [Spirochaetaceae bacterium]|nr:TolC family protein [Spirochaetaceae bacterium]